MWCFFFFWLCRVLVATRRIFCCGMRAIRCGMWASLKLWCVGSRARGLYSLQQAGSLIEACVGSVVVAHRLSCPGACGILVSRLGIEPASPALEGGLFTTGPPGKSLVLDILIQHYNNNALPLYSL